MMRSLGQSGQDSVGQVGQTLGTHVSHGCALFPDIPVALLVATEHVSCGLDIADKVVHHTKDNRVVIEVLRSIWHCSLEATVKLAVRIVSFLLFGYKL